MATDHHSQENIERRVVGRPTGRTRGLRARSLVLVSALVTGLVVVVAPASPATAQSAPAAGVYMPLTPSRILDTRNAGTGGIIAAQTSRDIQVTGLGGVPTSDVLAVVVDLTAVHNASDGWGLLWQQGTPRPYPASSINYVPGRAVTNAVTVKVGATGKVSYFTWVATDLVLDVVGYYRSSPGGGGYVPVTQTRILDTRDSGVKMAAGSTMDRKLRGVAGVPETPNVTAVAVNVSALHQDGPGFLTFWPKGVPRPGTSSLNFGTERMQTELVVATLSADGWTSIYNNTSANIHVLSMWSATTPRAPAPASSPSRPPASSTPAITSPAGASGPSPSLWPPTPTPPFS